MAGIVSGVFWRALVLAASASAAGLALGQSIGDPMRPPSAYVDADTSQEAGAAVEDDSAAAWRVSTILIPARGGASAVIDGQWLRLGAEFRGYRLTRIEHGRVVLEKMGESTQLLLTPDVQKVHRRAPRARSDGR